MLKASPVMTNDTEHLPPPSERSRLVFLAAVALVVAALDLATKAWVMATLRGYDPVRRGPKVYEVIPGWVDLIFAQNPGGAFSVLHGLGEGLRRPFFIVVSVVAIVFLVGVFSKVRPEQRALWWGLPLALGGALGNLVDRVRLGWVVDFIDVYVVRGAQEHHWPIFNVADVAISVGVVLIMLGLGRAHKGAPSGQAQVEPTQP